MKSTIFIDLSTVCTSPFRGGSLIVSFVDIGETPVLVPPLKGEWDREAVAWFTMNGTNLL